MTPTSHCYFDYYQGKVDEPVTIGGYLPVDKVYSYEPVPADLTPDEAKHILGAQANLWTEYMLEPAQVEYMLLPRLLALSEVVWTKKALRDYQDFSQRLVPQYDRLAAKGAGFRLPPPDGLGGQQVVTGPVAVTVSPPFPQAEVRFTLDGSEPTISSPLLLQPTIQVEKSALIQARTFLRSGRMSRTTSTSVSIVDPEQNGLEYGYYEGVWYKLPDFTGLAPVRTGRALSLSLDIDESRSQTFGLAFKGFIQIPNSGDYTFSLQTEAGGLISIAGQEIVRNDGLFRIREVSGRVRLEAGKWPLLVTYFKKSSGRQLRIFIEGPGSVRQILPAHWLYLK
jgi:hexosaminidase